MKFTAALMPGVENVLGIRLPVLRKIARQIAAGDWRTYLAEAEDFYFEERMLQGLVIGCAPLHAGREAGACGALRAQNQQLGGLRLFLLAPEGGRTAADVGIHTALFPIRSRIRRAFRRGDGAGEFRRRGAPRGTAATARRRPPRSLLRRMAVAWAVSVCYIKFPQRTHEWLGSCSLDDWTFNKSLQKNRRIVARERHGQTGDPRHETAQTGNFTGRREPAPRHRNGRAGGKTAWTGPKTTDRR